MGLQQQNRLTFSAHKLEKKTEKRKTQVNFLYLRYILTEDQSGLFINKNVETKKIV